MDRHSTDLDGRNDLGADDADPAIPLGPEPLGSDDASLIAKSDLRLRVPEKLTNLAELDVHYDLADCALWTLMRPIGRPSFTPSMLDDFVVWQDLIAGHFGPCRLPLKYLVLGSRTPGVFCFGGDLTLFRQLICDQDRKGLIAYGYRCVEILNRNFNALGLPTLTIGLVQGQALGGGFEALLSFDYIVAERQSTFGLPESTFGLFPGMGAHVLLTRKLGSALADRLILSNRTYSAQDMYDLGIVHDVVEPGEGVAAVRDFIARSGRKHAGLVNAKRALRVSSRIEMEEFYRIVELWAEAALQLREQDLKLMNRLANAQTRLAAAS